LPLVAFDLLAAALRLWVLGARVFDALPLSSFGFAVCGRREHLFLLELNCSISSAWLVSSSGFGPLRGVWVAQNRASAPSTATDANKNEKIQASDRRGRLARHRRHDVRELEEDAEVAVQDQP
jgi:hypothetical protein